PESSKSINIPHIKFDDNRDYHLNITYLDGNKLVAVEQLALNDVPYEFEYELGSKISAESENGMLTINFDKGFVKFDTEKALISNYSVDGTEYINQNPEGKKIGFNLNIFRALTDNDNAFMGKLMWLPLGLDKIKCKPSDFSVTMEPYVVCVKTKLDMFAKNNLLYFGEIDYFIDSAGGIDIAARVRANDDADEVAVDLPRVGLTLEMPEEFSDVAYYGRGRLENLSDFKEQSPVGIYKTTVKETHEPYIYPQENGMHGDVKWLKITNADGKGLKFYADNKIAFTAHDYTQDALFKAKHQEDLTDMHTTVLNIDGFVRGAGTAACGPDAEMEYRVDVTDGFEYKFTVCPIK
ncbi:MAG: beta-galactosidase small subunit, partial [Oscillospiraceae bacterium]|nr:beta-galactosidase small subunit [Oscillospiraceae bacterium]